MGPAAEIFCTVCLPAIERYGTNKERAAGPRPVFERRNYNVLDMFIAMNYHGLLISFFLRRPAKSLKKLKMAMGGSCQELAWMWDRRRILLGSAPQLRWIRGC
jgi:hypothetical protein